MNGKKGKTILQRIFSYGMTLIMTTGMCVGQPMPVLAEEATNTLVVATNFEPMGDQLIWHNEENWDDTEDEGPKFL